MSPLDGLASLVPGSLALQRAADVLRARPWSALVAAQPRCVAPARGHACLPLPLVGGLLLLLARLPLLPLPPCGVVASPLPLIAAESS